MLLFFRRNFWTNDLLVHLLLNLRNTDTAYNYFHEKYMFLLNKHAPLRKLTKKENKLKQNPWMTQGILKSISKKENFSRSLRIVNLKGKMQTIYTMTINYIMT